MASAGYGQDIPPPYFSGGAEATSASGADDKDQAPDNTDTLPAPGTSSEAAVIGNLPPAASSSLGPDEDAVALSAGSTKSAEASSEEVSQQCIQCIIDASGKEERAMTFDRAGAYPGAVNLYRESAAILSEALHLIPEDHPDHPVISIHIQEVSERAAYLYSLGTQPADIPLEDQIHGAELSIGQCAKGSRTIIAAGAVAGATGLVLVGPIVGVALAAGAAYATTRQDGIGKAARTAGDVGLKAVDKARALNEEHRLDEKLDQKLHITETARSLDDKLNLSGLAQRAGETVRALDEKLAISRSTAVAAEKTKAFAKSVDEQYGISNKSQAAVAKTAEAVSDFNEKHQVTQKINYHVSDAAATSSDWARRQVQSRVGAGLG